MTDTNFPADELIALRKDSALTQQEMADQLDMGLRSYQAIESGESAYRQVHRLAIERVALKLAAEKKDTTLAPTPVRRDAIELVRVGQATQTPEFLETQGEEPEPRKLSTGTERFRAAYSVVGELVLLTTALDHQLNHVLIQVLHLADSPMLEAVVATLDMNRKIEMLRARAKHINNTTSQKALLTHLDKLKKINGRCNIACHTALIPDGEHGAVFAPAAAAKLMKNLQLGDSPSLDKIPISEISSVIKIGESALFEGQQLIHNFERLNAERTRRNAAAANPLSTEPKPAGMTITACVDESGTHDTSPVSVMAGYVATAEQWGRFEADWTALVRKAGVQNVHAVELFKRTKQFKGWKEEDANALAVELNAVIDRHLQIGFSIIIRGDDYNTIYKTTPHPKRLPKDTKYGVLFRACLAFVPSFIVSQFNEAGQKDTVLQSTINFVLEDGHRNVGDALRLFRLYKSDALPEWRHVVGTLEVASKASAGAQAADFLAYAVYRAECLEHGQAPSDIKESSYVATEQAPPNHYPPRPKEHQGQMIFRIPITRDILQSLKDDRFARERERRAPSGA